MTVRRVDLEQPPLEVLSKGRNATKADVTVHRLMSTLDARTDSPRDSEGTLVVLKDFSARGPLVRATLARFSTAREARAYAQLSGLRGIPGFMGRVGGTALTTAFVPGRSLRDVPRRSLPPSFFTDLERLIASVHARGVALTDLHHRNVIVREDDGSPVLVDFSLAMVRPAAWNPIGRWFFDQAQRLDRLAFERIRERYMAPAGGKSVSPGTSPAPARRPLRYPQLACPGPPAQPASVTRARSPSP